MKVPSLLSIVCVGECAVEKVRSVLTLALGVFFLPACSGGGSDGSGGVPGTGGAIASGGGISLSGGSSSGGSATGGAASGGVSVSGGSSTGGTNTGGGNGELDMDRVLTARKLKRRLSLGDSDDSACIVTEAGGIECQGFFEPITSFNQPVDLVAFSGLGYCVIFDDTTVHCDMADNVSDETEAFVDSIGTAGHLVKAGTDGLLVVGVDGAVRAWEGLQVRTATVAPGSRLAGSGLRVCALSPTGEVSCFQYTEFDQELDMTRFEFETTSYIDLDQELMALAGITAEGRLRVRGIFEDNDIVYQDLQVQVATETDFWCMLDNAGNARCDSYDGVDGVPFGIGSPPAGEFLVLDVNTNFACGIRPSGAVECWGRQAPVFETKARLD